ncbi:MULTISPECIES: lipase secretion chaperone [unclassified Simplicispira]|uniref:lipase secretion chaperone n=1 Tax=unclassified Simplicispira TaxID=2630407 RepID=UPI000D5D7B53|nr:MULTISPECIES: lipase secretion chaperone [unclassified Simplicispira]PVY58085.1 lipase chaperone LimK [Simplicispira sp. 125]REG19029.1 lipase chaperone LimK [Simplicispira sp. 110]
MKKRIGARTLAVCALVGAGAVGWLALSNGSPLSTSAPGSSSSARAPSAPGAQVASTSYAAAGHGRTSGSTAADPLLTPGLRYALEALLMAAGEMSDPQRLKQRLEALVGQHFPPELATRALALAHRYVDYRVALGQLRPPSDQTDPQALRTVMAERQRVRLQYFDGDEFDALFAQDLALDEYMLARLEIERNSALTPEQKRSALQEAEQGLDPALRAQRAEAVAHEGVAQQTAAFNAQGVDERTRHAQRSAEYGPEAAQRLAQLDREQGDWNARLDQYQQAMASTQDPTRLAPLRSRLFSPEEQLRVEAALAARALPSPH